MHDDDDAARLGTIDRKEWLPILTLEAPGRNGEEMEEKGAACGRCNVASFCPEIGIGSVASFHFLPVQLVPRTFQAPLSCLRVFSPPSFSFVVIYIMFSFF